MNKAVLVLALFASAEGANLRRNVLEMTLATEELPTQTAAAPPPAAAPAAPAAAVGLAEPLPSQTAPAVAAPAAAAPVAAAAAPAVAPDAAVPAVAAAAPAVAAAAPTGQSENQVWAAGVAKKTTDEALLTLFDVAAQLKAVICPLRDDILFCGPTLKCCALSSFCVQPSTLLMDSRI